MPESARDPHLPAPSEDPTENLKRVLDDPNSTPAQIHAALAAGAVAAKLDSRSACIPQVDALIDAGWRFEIPSEESEPWQWKWRRPSRRTGSNGRLFLSTQQAYNALQREKSESREE